MADRAIKWTIRDPAGRISGPFTTEKILYLISKGEFSGEEFISVYPDGKWVPISSDPQFYDRLLEALQKKEDEIPNEPLDEEQEPLTEIDFKTIKRQRVNIDMENTPVGAPSSRPAAEKKPPPKTKKPRPKPRDIELFDTRKEFLQEILLRARLPAVIFIVGLLFIYLFMGGKEKSEFERIHLVGPQKFSIDKIPEDVHEKVQSNVVEFLRDTFESYLVAQNGFVSAIEANPKDPEVMALLCVVYLELWPYSFQDARDFKVISSLVQYSSSVDPGGRKANVCRTVDLIVRGRYSEAKSLTESMLESVTNETTPPIIYYYLKGYLLEQGGDNLTSVGYFHQATQLWPAWTRPYVMEGQAYARVNKASEAATLFRQVLVANPLHATALVELGILEYKFFDHLDRAIELIENGVSGGRTPVDVLSRGYLGLAEIAVKRGHQGRALKHAKKCYSLNPNNITCKNMIVQFGGSSVKGPKAPQLIFEGDQFFREQNYNSAQALYKLAYEENHNAVAAMKAAKSLWRMSFSTEAIDWLNRAIKADPKLIEAYVTMADYLTQRYNFPAATKILATAYKVNPKSAEVMRGFALIELRRGNAKGAIGFGKKALATYDADVETQILMARAYLATNDPDHYRLAYNHAAKAVEVDVNNREAQIVFAETLMGLQGVDTAIDYLQKMITRYELVTDYRLALGKLYFQDERYSEAEEVFRQVTRMDMETKPKDAYMELARTLRAEGHLNQALEYFFQAAVLDPADATPLFEAGIIYLDTGRGQEAIAQLERVQKINKLYPLVHYQMGRAQLLMKNPEKALEETRIEKSTNPNLADSYLLAADAHAALGQFTQCATEYQKAIKLRPQVARIYVKLAQCYRKSGSLEAANDMLAYAASQEQGLADIYKEQGAIYEMKGDMVHAIEAYNQYFVLDPQARDREQIEQRILQLQQTHGSGH